MRDVKFRGKRVDNNKWVYGYYEKKWIRTIKSDGRYEHYIVNQIEDENGQIWNETFQVIPETVCQFVGLLDKNKKEIYEFDIVKKQGTKGTIPAFSTKTIIACVVYHRGAFRLKKYWVKEPYQSNEYILDYDRDYGESKTSSKFRSNPKSFEVIGNIFENPEMLKEKTNVE